MNLDVRRQDLAVQFFSFCLDSFQDVLRLLTTQHENHALYRVVIFLEPEFAEPRRVPDRHLADIPHSYRHALVCADHDVANVVGVAYQTNSANVIELAALRIKAATGIRVVGGQGGGDLRNRKVISVDARRIEQDLVLHHRAAETGIVCHAVDRPVGSLDYPVFDGFQFLRTTVGTFEHIAIDQAARAKQGREGWSDSGRQCGLGEPFKYDLPRKIAVGAFLKGEDYV